MLVWAECVHTTHENQSLILDILGETWLHFTLLVLEITKNGNIQVNIIIKIGGAILHV